MLIPGTLVRRKAHILYVVRLCDLHDGDRSTPIETIARIHPRYMRAARFMDFETWPSHSLATIVYVARRADQVACIVLLPDHGPAWVPCEYLTDVNGEPIVR